MCKIKHTGTDIHKKLNVNTSSKKLINSTLSKSQSSNNLPTKIYTTHYHGWPGWQHFHNFNVCVIATQESPAMQDCLFCSAFAWQFANRSRTRRSEEQFLGFSFYLRTNHSKNAGLSILVSIVFFRILNCVYTTLQQNHIVNAFYNAVVKGWKQNKKFSFECFTFYAARPGNWQLFSIR